MTPLAVILYEDQRGPEKEFGLHNLLVACVADDAGEDRFALRRKLDGRPMKGVQNLIRSCRRDMALQKDVNARDAIFNRISWQSDRAVRDCIRQRVEAILEIVKALATLVRAGDGSV